MHINIQKPKQLEVTKGGPINIYIKNDKKYVRYHNNHLHREVSVMRNILPSKPKDGITKLGLQGYSSTLYFLSLIKALILGTPLGTTHYSKH